MEDGYKDLLKKKVFLSEWIAMSYISSNNIEELRDGMKRIIAVTSGSPSKIKEMYELY